MCPRGPYPKPTAANNRLGARRSMSRGIARSPRHRARAKATRLRISWITRRTRAPAPVGRRRPPSVVRSTGGGATARDFCIAIAKAAARSATGGAAALVPMQVRDRAPGRLLLPGIAAWACVGTLCPPASTIGRPREHPSLRLSWRSGALVNAGLKTARSLHKQRFSRGQPRLLLSHVAPLAGLPHRTPSERSHRLG